MKCPDCGSIFFSDNKLYCKVCNYYMIDEKKHSDYFVHFVINKHDFDFNLFKNREDFDNYNKEMEEFLKGKGSK